MLRGLALNHQREPVTHSIVNELSLKLEMPGRSEGEMIPPDTLLNELLWQHYGLDLLHPEVSRWLESHAPDVKYAMAENRFANGGGRGSARFRVGPDGAITVHLSPEVDDRLREVSSGYVESILTGAELREAERQAEPAIHAWIA